MQAVARPAADVETARAVARDRGSHVRLFRFYDITSRWYDLHPGWRLNHHDKQCDCTHFCSADGAFSVAARELLRSFEARD